MVQMNTGLMHANTYKNLNSEQSKQIGSRYESVEFKAGWTQMSCECEGTPD